MSPAVYDTALVFHVVGITVMAGTTFIDLVTFQAFGKAYETNRAKALLIEEQLQKLQKYLGIGMLIILVSGVTMMVKLHEVWGAQLWFRIKMVVLLFIVFNGLGLRRVVGRRLNKFVGSKLLGSEKGDEYVRLRINMRTIQWMQIALFTLIYVLSIFKFN